MQQAQNALDSLNAELRVLQKNKSVQLKYGRLATAIDMWIDDGLFDALTHLQINIAQKRMQERLRRWRISGVNGGSCYKKLVFTAIAKE